jgi:hypothetical protein
VISALKLFRAEFNPKWRWWYKEIYLSGNTIRIQATFTDFDDTATDPDVIKLIIYDSKYTKLSEYTLTSANKVSTGVYYYDYTTPTGTENKKYYY